MEQALDRASLMAREGKNNLVKMSFRENQLTVYSNAEMGNVEETVETNETEMIEGTIAEVVEPVQAEAPAEPTAETPVQPVVVKETAAVTVTAQEAPVKEDTEENALAKSGITNRGSAPATGRRRSVGSRRTSRSPSASS